MLASATRKARGPALAGSATAVAVAGGALLKRQLAPKRRKVLGVRVPTPHMNGLLSGGLDLKPVGKQVSRAGKRVVTTSQQLSRLSDAILRVGKATEKVGDSLS
jgi:hypothetical protein